MTTVLVTGASGNIGSQVVQELRRRGVAVRAFVRNPDMAAAKLGNTALAVGNFSDPASIRRALSGVDQVFLCSADGPDKVAHEIAVIDAAVAAGIDRIVKLSTIHAQVGSPLPTFDWHGTIETYLAHTGLPAVVLRSSFFMSNLMLMARGIAQAGQLFAPASDARVAMIHPQDVAAAAAAVLHGAGQTGSSYLITGGTAVSFADVAQALTTATGRPVAFADIPEQAAMEAFKGSGFPEWLVTQLVGVFRLIRQGAYEQSTQDVHKLIGRAPHTIVDFANDYASVFGR